MDDKGLFRNIYVGIPGSAHDAAVLRQSDLYRKTELHPHANIQIDGIDIPLMLAGDPAYPLLPWLVKAYPGPMLTPVEEAFNKHLNAIRVAVEHSFGRLKARWRILSKRSDIHYEFMPAVITACCVLHNICELENQRRNPVDVPGQVDPDNQPPGRPCEDVPTAEASIIRSTLRDYVRNKLNL